MKTTMSKNCERVWTQTTTFEWTGLQIAQMLGTMIAVDAFDTDELLGSATLMENLPQTPETIVNVLAEENWCDGDWSADRDIVADWHVELARQHLKKVWPDPLVTRGLKTLVGREWEEDPTPERHGIYLTCWAQPSYDEPFWQCSDCGTWDFTDHSPDCQNTETSR